LDGENKNPHISDHVNEITSIALTVNTPELVQLHIRVPSADPKASSLINNPAEITHCSRAGTSP